MTEETTEYRIDWDKFSFTPDEKKSVRKYFSLISDNNFLLVHSPESFDRFEKFIMRMQNKYYVMRLKSLLEKGLIDK